MLYRRTLLTSGITVCLLASGTPAFAASPAGHPSAALTARTATQTASHTAASRAAALKGANLRWHNSVLKRLSTSRPIEVVRTAAAQLPTVPAPTGPAPTLPAPTVEDILPTGPSGVAVPTGDQPGWKQVMTQDFTGSTLPTGWGSYEGQPGGEPNGKWLHSHTTVGNGVMTLAGYQDGGRFTTGGVMASGAGIGGLTYGKYEIRFKIAKGHGVKYAALLWPVSERWPVDGEIDFAEDGGGARDTSTGTIHYGADNSQIQKTATGDFSSWTTMGVEWTPSKVVYTMNGLPWATVTGSAVPHTAMNLAIQTQAGTCGSWAGATCPDATTPAHVDMQVDWAVAYSYNP